MTLVVDSESEDQNDCISHENDTIVDAQAERLIRERSPYSLGLGPWGTHRTFRPLLLVICNNTLLPSSQAAYALESDRLSKHWRLDELTRVSWIISHRADHSPTCLSLQTFAQFSIRIASIVMLHKRTLLICARVNNAGAHLHAWLQRSSVGTVSNEQRGFRSEMGIAAPGKMSEHHIVSCFDDAFMACIADPGSQDAIWIMSIALGGRIDTTDDGWRTGDIGHAANRGRCHHVGGGGLGLQA